MHQVKYSLRHLEDHLNQNVNEVWGGAAGQSDQKVTTIHRNIMEAKESLKQHYQKFVKLHTVSGNKPDVVIQSSKAFQNLKPEYQEIIRGDILDQLLRRLKIKGLQINANEIEEQKLRELWNFQDTSSESSITALSIHRSMSDWAEEEIVMLGGHHDEVRRNRRNQLFEFNQCIKSNKYLLATSTRDMYDQFKQQNLVNFHINSPVIDGDVIFSPLLQGESLIKIMESEVRPFQMSILGEWFNGVNNSILHAKKYWKLRSAYRNVNILVMSEYLCEYVEQFVVACPPPPHKQIAETVDKHAQALSTWRAYSICEDATQILTALVPFLRWAGVTQKDSDTSGSLLMHTIDQVFVEEYQTLNAQFFGLMSSARGVDVAAPQTSTTQIETFIKQDGMSSGTSAEIPFAHFISDILNSAGGELWTQSELSRYVCVFIILSDFGLNYDKDWKTLQQKLLGVAQDAQCNQWIKVLFLEDLKLIQQKLTLDAKIYGNKAHKLLHQPTTNLYVQYYERYLKMLLLKTKSLCIRLLSYANVFRHLQWLLNNTYKSITTKQSQFQFGEATTTTTTPTTESQQFMPIPIFSLTNPMLASNLSHQSSATQQQSSEASHKHFLLSNGLVIREHNQIYQLVNVHKGQDFHYDCVFSDFLDVMALVEKQAIVVLEGQVVHGQNSYQFLKNQLNVASQQRQEQSRKVAEATLFTDVHDREYAIWQVTEWQTEYLWYKARISVICFELVSDAGAYIKDSLKVKFIEQLVCFMKAQLQFDGCQPYNFGQCAEYQLSTLRHLLELLHTLTKHKDSAAQIMKTILQVWCYLDSVYQDTTLDALIQMYIHGETIKQIWSQYNRQNILKNDNISKFSLQLHMQSRIMERLKLIGEQLMYGTSETSLPFLSELDQFLFLQNDPLLDNLNSYEKVHRTLKLKLQDDINKNDSTQEDKQDLLDALQQHDMCTLLFNFSIDRDSISKTPSSDKFNLRSLNDLVVVRKKLYKQLIQGVMISNILKTQLQSVFMDATQFECFIETLINKGVVQTSMMTKETVKSTHHKYKSMFYSSLLDIGQMRLTPFLHLLKDWVPVALSRKNINLAYKTLECVTILNTSIQAQTQTNIILFQEFFQQYMNDNATQIRKQGVEWHNGLLHFRGIDALIAQCINDKIEVGRQSKDQFRLIEIMSKNTNQQQSPVLSPKTTTASSKVMAIKDKWVARMPSTLIKAKKQDTKMLFRGLVEKVIEKYALNTRKQAQPKIMLVIEQYLKMNASLLQHNGDEGDGQAYLLYEFGRRLRYQYHHLQFKIRAMVHLTHLKKVVYSVPTLNYLFKEATMKINFDSKATNNNNIVFEELLDFSDQIRSLLVLPPRAYLISLQHFNYDNFAPKRHVNKKKIAGNMPQDIKERSMKVDDGEQPTTTTKKQRLYDDDWNRTQQIKIDKKLSLLSSAMLAEGLKSKDTSLAYIQSQEQMTQIESRWIQLYRPRKEFKIYSTLEPLTRLPVFQLMKVYESMCKIIQLQLSVSMLSVPYEEDVTFQLALLTNYEMYVAFQTCAPHFAQAAHYKNKIANSTLLVRTVLEKQFSNGNQRYAFLIKKSLLDSGYVEYGLRCKEQLASLSQTVLDLEATIPYIKNNPKISDENEALTTYLKKRERNIFDVLLLTMYSTFNASRCAAQQHPLHVGGQHQLKQILIKCGLGGVKHLARDAKNDLCVRKDFNELSQHKSEWLRKMFRINNKDEDLGKLGKLLMDTNTRSQSSFMEVLSNLFLMDKSLTNYSMQSMMNSAQQFNFHKRGNLYAQQTSWTQSIESHSFLLPFLVNINKLQREKINVRFIKIQIKIDNRQRQEMLDLHKSSGEIFFVEKVKHQVLKLRLRARLLNEINFSFEHQRYPLACDPRSNHLFGEFKKRLSIIFHNQSVVPQSSTHKKQSNSEVSLYTKFDENVALKTLLMKLVIVTFDLDRLLILESVKYYQGHLVQVAVHPTQPQQGDELLSIVVAYDHRIHQDSCQILTINKGIFAYTTQKQGPAFVISCGDYVTNLQSLTVDLCTQRDVHFTARLQELELRNQQLQEQLSVYRDKCDTLSKENEFVRINMGNIVDARVTQRTSELLYQLDQFKKFTQDFSKDEYARSIQQKLDIHDQYAHQLAEQSLQQSVMHQKHSDYKIGLNSELEGFTQVLLQSKTREIKGLLTSSLGGDVSLSVMEQFNKLEQHDRGKHKGELVIAPHHHEVIQLDTIHKNSLKSIQALYCMFKQMRVFYVLKSNRAGEQFNRQLQGMQSQLLNTENNLIQIKELQEDTTSLRQQLVDAKRTISILEHQTQMLQVRKLIESSTIQRSLQELDKNKLLYQQHQAQHTVQLKELKSELKDLTIRKSINFGSVGNSTQNPFDSKNARPMTANFSMQSVFSGDVESQNVTGVLVKRKEFALHQQQLQTLITDQPHSRTSSATLKRHKKVSQQQFTIKSQPDVAAIDACMQTNVVQIVTSEDVKPDVKVTSITKYKSPKQSKTTSQLEKYITSKTVKGIVAYKSQNPKNY